MAKRAPAPRPRTPGLRGSRNGDGDVSPASAARASSVRSANRRRSSSRASSAARCCDWAKAVPFHSPYPSAPVKTNATSPERDRLGAIATHDERSVSTSVRVPLNSLSAPCPECEGPRHRHPREERGKEQPPGDRQPARQSCRRADPPKALRLRYGYARHDATTVIGLADNQWRVGDRRLTAD